VDGLEAEWGGDVQVMRVNVRDRTARPLLARLGFRFTPTFILFAEDGREVWRTAGSLAAAEVNEQINAHE
jgi:hypothetical protein